MLPISSIIDNIRNNIYSFFKMDVITDDNIREFTSKYYHDKNTLPYFLRNKPIGEWNVSNVTDMSHAFEDFSNFNDDISKWDVSNVRYMIAMFMGAHSFNQPIGNWNVSKVVNMKHMFCDAFSFNQSICNWNVSNVIDMSYMFSNAIKFNQPIGVWNVSNVMFMNNMFSNAQSFNQPIGNWNVSSVFNMADMFFHAHTFNQSIGNWNVHNVSNMSRMFCNAWTFNQPIGNWNVLNVVQMCQMFERAVDFNQDLSKWEIKNNCNTKYMFFGSGMSPYLQLKNASKCDINIPKLSPISKTTTFYNMITCDEQCNLYDVLMEMNDNKYANWVFIYRYYDRNNNCNIKYFCASQSSIVSFTNNSIIFSTGQGNLKKLGVLVDANLNVEYLFSVFRHNIENPCNGPNLYLIEQKSDKLVYINPNEYFIS